MKKQILLFFLVSFFSFSLSAQTEKFTFKSAGPAFRLDEGTAVEGDITLTAEGGTPIPIQLHTHYQITPGVKYTVTGKFSMLRVDEQVITEINISELKNLQRFSCRRNKLEYLDASGLVNLITLWCDYNDIVAVNLSSLDNLEYLCVHENRIESLDLSNLKKLKELWCKTNDLTSLDVSGLIHLEDIFCEENSIESLDFSGLMNLKQIRCNENRLTSLQVSGLPNLEILSCVKNQLTNIDISGLTGLKILACEDNEISSLALSELTSLEYLLCARNQLESLTVPGLVNLKGVTCTGNLLETLDFSNLTSLETVYCNENYLEHINLSGTKELRTLDCNNNALTSLNVSSSDELRMLVCSGNLFSVCDLDSLFVSLPTRLSHDNALILIAYNNADQSPIIDCRTYIAKDKKWNVMGSQDGDLIHIFNPGPYGCAEISIPEIFVSQTEVSLYPNPVVNELQVKSDKMIMEISVFDMAGKLVLSQIGNDTHESLVASGLKPGIYAVRVKTAAEVKNFKIIKE